MAELSKEKFQIVGKNLKAAQEVVRPSMTYWQDAWRRLKVNKIAMLTLSLLCIMIFMAIIGPMIRPFVYDEGNLFDANLKASSKYWFGTDDIGRDLWTRVWWGARLSLFIGVVVALANLTIGILYGGISGYLGGKVDDIMMRFVELLITVPQMLWIIMLMVVMGQGVATIMIAMTATGWAGTARIVRGQVLQLKEMEYVMAAKVLGSDMGRVVFKHLIPNTMGILIISVTFAIPAAIFTEAFLSFIGIGIPVPIPSLGSLSREGTNMLLVHPYQLMYPSIVISIIMLAFQIFGDGLRDALDPRLRQ